jgi:hypothetical protein
LDLTVRWALREDRSQQPDVPWIIFDEKQSQWPI